jgi:hypothetical protein
VGASPLFPPEAQTPDQARERILAVLHESPRAYDQALTRWTLPTLRQACPWWHDRTLVGVWGVLQRLDIHWLRGRDHLHSPDPHYHAKREMVGLFQALVERFPGEHVLLWQDEISYYRQPTLSYGWEVQGRQPLAERSYRANTLWRVVAALNASNGAVHYQQAAHISVPVLVGFYTQLCAHYPGQQLWLVQDNWPVHFHPDVLAALEPQETPFPWYVPKSWARHPAPTPGSTRLPIQLVPLPTYAPWCNPIEKLWRWLRQDRLHLHPWANDLEALQGAVDHFLIQFAFGSTDLLRYVGLLVPH